MRAAEEKSLIKRLKRGDTDALRQIIEYYSAYICAIISNVFSGALPPEDVEECAADVFVALWENRHKVEPGGLKPYIAVIARNRALSRLRAAHIEQRLDDDYPLISCKEPESAALTRELSALMRTAVDSLPPPDDEIFRRHYFLFQKTADIARELGMNEATVRTKLRRGRGRLREYFTERGYDCEDIYN